MVLHDSVIAAVADTHRRDLLDQAERFRMTRSVRAAARAAGAASTARAARTAQAAPARPPVSASPPPVVPTEAGVRHGKADTDRRYAVSR